MGIQASALGRPSAAGAAVARAYARVQTATVDDLHAEVLAATEMALTFPNTRKAVLRFDLVVLGRDQLEDALDRFGYSGAAADTGLGDGDLSSDDGAAAVSGRPAGSLRMLEHRLRVHVSEVDDQHRVLKERDLSVVQFYRLYYEMESLSSASQDALFKSVLSSYRGNAKTPESALDECIICMERKAEVSLHCTHSYCSECIRQWSAEHSECPMCRGNIGSEDDAWVLQETPTQVELAAGVHKLMRHMSEREQLGGVDQRRSSQDSQDSS